MIANLLYVLFAPLRWLLNLLPSVLNFQQEMRRSASLSLECYDGTILVRPVRPRHRGQRGAAAIAEALQHIQPTVASVRPYTARERAKLKRLTAHDPVGPGHLAYKLPVELSRASAYYDEGAWDALAERVSELSSPISLAELERLEIEAYVATRPDDFDFKRYYGAYR